LNCDWRIGKPTALPCPVMVAPRHSVVTDSILHKKMPDAKPDAGLHRYKIRSVALRDGVSRATRDCLQTL
jgi:hypothetical protein